MAGNESFHELSVKGWFELCVLGEAGGQVMKMNNAPAENCTVLLRENHNMLAFCVPIVIRKFGTV